MERQNVGPAVAFAAVALACAMVVTGPSVDAQEWRPLGPGGGEILSIALGSLPEEVLYAGTGSGVFKSFDGGLSWERCGLAGERVVAVAVDPTMTTQVYAAAIRGGYGEGGLVFASSDGGITWVESSSGLEDPRNDDSGSDTEYLRVTSLLVDRHDPQTVWAGTSVDFGLYKSSDAGATWSKGRFSDEIRMLADHPTTEGVVFASVGYIGLYRSVNAGASWSYLGNEMLGYRESGRRYHLPVVGIAISETEPDVVYAATTEDIFKSTDGGYLWESLGVLPSSVQSSARPAAIASDPLDADSAFVATRYDGVFRTIDGGMSWEQVGEGLECGAEGRGVPHRRVSNLEFAPSGSQLFLGTEFDGFFVRSLAGDTWLPSNTGLFSTDATTAAVNPKDPRHLLVAARDSGILRSNDGGTTWVASNLQGWAGCSGPPPPPDLPSFPDCNGFHTIEWPDGDSPLLAASECGVYVSHDRGETWDRSESQDDGVGAMAVAPGDPQRVYLARSPSEIEHSVDGGVTWSPCARIQIQNGSVLSLAVNPEDASTVIAGTNQGVYTSLDGCASWEGHLDDINARCPDGRWTDVDAIEFDPNLSGLVYAGTSCGVFASDDGGDRWQSAGLEDLDISALAFGRDEILAGTWGDGVWASDDSGATWTRISTDDQSRYVNDLFVDPVLRKVYSATSGNGMVVLDRWLPEPRRPSRRVPITKPDGKAFSVRE